MVTMQTETDEIDPAYAIAQQIHELARSVDDPDCWIISVPVEHFNAVEGRLATDDTGLGTKFEGMSLCYTEQHDQTRVKYRATLDGCLRSINPSEGRQA